MTFFTSLSIINPLTLLIIPLIGSLIILIYPFFVTNYRSSSIVALANKQVKLTASEGKQVVANHSIDAIKELIEVVNIEKQNSNLKKIAIITSLINFFISLILLKGAKNLL